MSEIPIPKQLASGLLAGCLSAAVALVLFIFLAQAVSHAETQQIDDRIRAAIHQYSSPWLSSLMQMLTVLGATAFLVPVGAGVVLCLAFARRPLAALLFVIMIDGAVLLNVALKWAFQRGRPAPFFDLSPPRSYSFPSGHALFSFCFYGFLALAVTKSTQSHAGRIAVWGLAALIIAAIGFSRIYLGVHYPTDVLGGYVVGFFWTVMLGLGYRFLQHRE
ncbi:MAG TPA: phosphatase PAP2 family protein [Acidobacteriota bacterium]|jgi:undecaprenyl-diphosphatase